MTKDCSSRVLRQAGVENPVNVVRDGDETIAYLKGKEVLPIARSSRCHARYSWT